MKLIKLVVTGAISGVVLAASMKVIHKITGNPSEVLLYNMDYIPYLKHYKDNPFTGYSFHYVTCISSAVGLYYILKPMDLEKKISPYMFVYTMGSGALFFLSKLTEEPPKSSDFAAWSYWTGSHLLFGFTVGSIVKKLK